MSEEIIIPQKEKDIKERLKSALLICKFNIIPKVIPKDPEDYDSSPSPCWICLNEDARYYKGFRKLCEKCVNIVESDKPKNKLVEEIITNIKSELEKKAKLFDLNRKKIFKEYPDLIINFVERFDIDSKEQKERLKELLLKKGIKLDNGELDIIIDEGIIKQEYNNFKKRILYSKPKNLKEYITVFLEVVGDNYEEKLGNFHQLLDGNGIAISFFELCNGVNMIKKDIELEMFEEKLKKEDFEQMNMNKIDSISGYEFESFLRELFIKMGYKVISTKLSGDQGADLVIEKFGEKIAVQAKKYSKPVSNKAVQEVVASRNHYACDKAIVITNNWFTESAQNLALSNGVELWDRDKLSKEIEAYF